MTVDQYAMCPCGNGKKIKFCKCKDSLPELDRITTMLSGGQVVPALDRINRVLQEHPDAAWALAIKGRVLIGLREFESLAENAERFVRLQPNNPLALTQRAASEIFSGRITEATDSILEALTESGRNVDTFVLEIVSMLSYALAGRGLYLSGRAYATLALSAEEYEGAQTAASVLRELNTSPAVSHLLKSLPNPRPRPDRVDWAERFDEAVGLLRSNKIVLAETKFASLARTYPGQPAILSGLLSCAVWRGDVAAQAECLKKLADCEQLDLPERSKLLAMSWLVDRQSPEMTVELRKLTAEIEDASLVETALHAHARAVAVPEQSLRELSRDDDVPPRSAFHLTDREMPDAGAEITADNLPEAMTLVLVFGKQTDRPARLEIPAVPPFFVDAVREIVKEAAGEQNWQESETFRLPVFEACEPRPLLMGRQYDPRTVQPAAQEFRARRLSRRLIEQPLAGFGNRSLSEIAGDDSARLQREAFIRMVENFDSLGHEDRLVGSLREAAAVEPLPPITLRTSDDLETVDNADLGRVDCSSLDADGLEFLLQRSQMIRATAVVQRAGEEVLRRDGIDTEVKAFAYVSLIENSAQPEAAIELLDQAKRYFESNSLDAAQLYLLELPQRLRMGDAEGFQRTIGILTSQYRHREDVMAAVQHMLVSLGIINPDGTMRRRGPAAEPVPAAAPASAGGIWTPGSDAPAAGQPAGSGESKLWVPGMD